MSARAFAAVEFYEWLCKQNAVEPFPDQRRWTDPYWREAQTLTRYVNKKCREKGLV